MNKKIIISIVILIGISLNIYRTQISKNPLGMKLKGISEEINKGCPIVVNNTTTLTTTYITSDNRFSYIYTLKNVMTDSLSKLHFFNNQKETIASILNTSPKMKFFKENKIQVNYQFFESTGVFYGDINIDSTDYN